MAAARGRDADRERIRARRARRRPLAGAVETAARVLLTPFAVATDVVFVAGCVVLLPFGLLFFFNY